MQQECSTVLNLLCPLLKSRVTLFVFKKKTDYSAFYSKSRLKACIKINRPAQKERFEPAYLVMIATKGKIEFLRFPIDTNDVELTPDIVELCELLAKNTHEVWSETRIKDGWSYGKERNDANRKHPCLIPYEELSEAEKEYDRNTSIKTLKLIVKLGF
jgi:hypothetical protein